MINAAEFAHMLAYKGFFSVAPHSIPCVGVGRCDGSGGGGGSGALD